MDELAKVFGAVRLAVTEEEGKVFTPIKYFRNWNSQCKWVIIHMDMNGITTVIKKFPAKKYGPMLKNPIG